MEEEDKKRRDALQRVIHQIAAEEDPVEYGRKKEGDEWTKVEEEDKKRRDALQRVIRQIAAEEDPVEYGRTKEGDEWTKVEEEDKKRKGKGKEKEEEDKDRKAEDEEKKVEEKVKAQQQEEVREAREDWEANERRRADRERTMREAPAERTLNVRFEAEAQAVGHALDMTHSDWLLILSRRHCRHENFWEIVRGKHCDKCPVVQLSQVRSMYQCSRCQMVECWHCFRNL